MSKNQKDTPPLFKGGQGGVFSDELQEILADTKAYLLFLKETGVEEMFAKSKAEARGKKEEVRSQKTETRNNNQGIFSSETSMSEALTKENANPPLCSRGGMMETQIPPFVQGGAGGVVSDEPKADLLHALLEKISDCKRCKLSTGRTNIVFGTGNPDTKLMFVGEGPGEEEDRQGKPFVGKAGELLTKMITAMGLTRDDVYIANVVKCRPPGNRNPESDAITACSPFLKEQIDIIKPEIICTLGTFASQTLLETKTKISELRGKIHLKDGYRVIPTFHPAYLLRNPGEKIRSWQDLQIIMKELEQAEKK